MQHYFSHCRGAKVQTDHLCCADESHMMNKISGLPAVTVPWTYVFAEELKDGISGAKALV